MPIVIRPESAAERPLTLRMRPELQFARQTFGSKQYWAVKDPIALKYFQLRCEEHAILTMLDGRISLDELRRRWEQMFAPQRTSYAELLGFLGTLHRHGLLLAEVPGQAEQLLLRHGDDRRRRMREALLGVLAIRFRGIHPQRLVDWLYPKFRFLFSPACVIACLVLAVAAALLVAIEFETVRSRLPSFRSFLTANLLWLVAALATTKVLHELGHLLACRHFGGQPSEVGMMLLLFTPCLYCNVSDSWMLPNKWQRIAIAAAGMYVELILASLCTLLWWFSQPGLLNSLCLNIMLLCSIGTILFNGNPLMRYDGYFILSDLCEVPNLGARSAEAVRRILAKWCLGLAVGDDRASATRRQGWLVPYAVASSVYRWTVVIAVLWGLRELLSPDHLEILVVLLGGLILMGMAWPTVAEIVRFAREPSTRRRIVPARAALACAILLAAGFAVAVLPFPASIQTPVVIDYRDAQRIYVVVPGTLTASVRAGESVERGQVLARLENPSVETEVAKLNAERNRRRVYLADLEARTLQGVDDGAQIPSAKSALADAERRLDQLERDAAQLTIGAPSSGTVLPPPGLPRKSRAPNELDRWLGSPLDERNRGCYLETGTLLCSVGDPTAFEAILHVGQADVELVQTGQRVELVLDHAPGKALGGTVVEIAKLDLGVVPPDLAVVGQLPARIDRHGVAHPLDTLYQARVFFDRDYSGLLAGIHGRAKILVAPQPLGSRVGRYLKQTFGR